ncbi:MAG TPA: hypothetical protein VEA78_09780, partial [Acidimicrobiales bacterium]|nr:hypothetical protein [Acidimicrobiales bacterium]
MAAITIDSPRWRDGWGESIRHDGATARPELRVVTGGTGVRRPEAAVYGRRRLLVALAALVLVALTVIGATSLLAAPATAGEPAVGRVTHVVQPG